jgi:hypothetical protein
MRIPEAPSTLNDLWGRRTTDTLDNPKGVCTSMETGCQRWPARRGLLTQIGHGYQRAEAGTDHAADAVIFVNTDKLTKTDFDLWIAFHWVMIWSAEAAKEFMSTAPIGAAAVSRLPGRRRGANTSYNCQSMPTLLTIHRV